MADIPFFRSPTIPDALTASLAAQCLYTGNIGQLVALLSAVEPVTLDMFHGYDSFSETWAVLHSSRFIFVVTSGIQSSTQAILAIVGSAQVSTPGIPGAVGAYWASITFEEGAAVLPIIAPLVPGRRIVLIGHSLGGAVSACLLPLFQSTFPSTPIVVFSFGSPRPGDPAFIAATQPWVHDFICSDDPVAAIPPTTWAGPGSAWPASGPPPLSTYARWSDATKLAPDGTLSTGDSDMNAARAAWLFLTGQTDAHQLPEYSRRLGINLPTPITPEYEDYTEPSTVETVLRFFLPEAPMGYPTGNYMVRFFFNYGVSAFSPSPEKPYVARASCGITEDVWTTLTGIDAWKGLVSRYLGVRMNIAVDQFSFLYARITNPQTKRWVDWVLPAQQSGPTQGQLGTSSPSGPRGSNDTSAVLMKIKISGGPSGRIFLHAYDGRQGNEGTFTPNSNWSSKFPDYQNFFQDAANQIKFAYSPAVGTNPKHRIATLVPQTPRGYLITSSDGTIPNLGDFLSITGMPRAMQGAGGRKTVTGANDPAGSFLVGGAQPVGTFPVGSQAFWQLVNPLFGNYAYSAAEYLTSHRVGRPFAALLGRKKNRLTLRL